MKEISAIIVSWNAREYLRGCLKSIRECGGLAMTNVIVVDNASTDGSPEMVEREYPEAKLIRSAENLGFARANNLVLNDITTPYVAFINSDVVVHPGCLETLVRFLKAHPGVGLCGPKVFGGDGRLQLTHRRLPTLWNTLWRSLALDTVVQRFAQGMNRTPQESESHSVEALTGCFWLARRKAINEVGGLDERFFMYAEDIDWCMRYRQAGWNIMYVPEATATHFGGASSANAPLRYSLEMLRANIVYSRKHRGPAGHALFYILSLLHHSLRVAIRGTERALRPAAQPDDAANKYERSLLCIRWLLTGKGL